MIDSSPKPLVQQRLVRIVEGLQQRATGSVQRVAETVAQLEKQITSEQQAFSDFATAHREQSTGTQEQTITDWDEAIQACWDSAELQTYQAIYRTADRERKLKAEAQAKVEATTAEAQKRIAAVDRKFLAAKEAPIKKLRNFRAANRELESRLRTAEANAQAAVTQRSLAIPADESTGASTADPTTANAAYRELQQIVDAVEQQAQRITHSRLAALFDSVLFWAGCAVLFLLVLGGLLLTGTTSLVPAILIAAVATGGILIFFFLGLRPWLKRSLAAEYPKLQGLLTEGQQLYEKADSLAVRENEAELSQLAQKRDEKFLEIKQWRDQTAADIGRQFEAEVLQTRQQAAQSKLTARSTLDAALAEHREQFESQLHEVEDSAQRELTARQAELESRQTELRHQISDIDQGSRARLQRGASKAIQAIANSQRWTQLHFPSWDSFRPDGEWPEALNDPQLLLGHLPLTDVLPTGTTMATSPKANEAPLLFSPLHDKYLVIHGDPSAAIVREMLRGLLMRALTNLPPGRSQVCVIDPPGLGRDFGWLMHLGDFDADLVHHRVWTQTPHISKQLETLSRSAEDFIQQSLRNEYSNIMDYNREAGAMAEPFRFLVWTGLPLGLDEPGWRNLQSLLDTGARCGIIPILVVDPNQAWTAHDALQSIQRRGLHLKIDENAGKPSLIVQHGRTYLFEPATPPSQEESQKILQEVGRRSLLAGRVEVPLLSMLPTERWQADSSQMLEIPIGRSGVGRTHSLKLGIGTAQHAIIAGKTGSGKSSLLHALITSAVTKYSPESLRLVLLDFKKGVEFQVYADTKLAHADIIGIESHREFGLSGLQFIDACLQRRGEMFRQASVQDLISWNAIHPDQPLPRLLLIVDEFQELFVEDDKLANQASLILDRIVRQGRSFGVHAILSSQTLAGSYTLPRTTLGQMAVRIALQCDASDAQIIFAEDNPAASRLKLPGQAVYNDAGGRIEGNQPMQIGWLKKEQQVDILAALPSGYQNHDPSTNRLGKTIVFDGNRPATWNADAADLAIESARSEVNPNAVWCIVGESVAIQPAVVFPLTRQAGRNVLLVGADDSQAAAVMDVITYSFLKQPKAAAQPTSTPRLYCLQAAKPTDAKSLQLSDRWRSQFKEFKQADARHADELIAEVHSLLRQRMEEQDPIEGSSAEMGLGDEAGPETGASANSGKHFGKDDPILLNIIQIGRVKELRKEDDFASFGESEMTPTKRLEELLRDGPSYGVHVLVWAENYSTVNRWLSRSALREMEIRLLMQMSANDSTNLVDSIAASRLGEHVMLLFDEATGQEQRFRPYSIESLHELESWRLSRPREQAD